LDGAKRNLGWPIEPRFYIQPDVLEHFRTAVERGKEIETTWQKKFEAYRSEHPELSAELARQITGNLPAGWDSDLTQFPPDPKGQATRVSSGKILNELANRLPELLGGSADLTPSTKTYLAGKPAFQSDSPRGRNFHFGVREHAMGTLVNGMALHGGLIPYGATFLTFSDYMRPAIRLSAISHAGSIWVFTHDSIGLGEDGPTHQPVEHMAALRAIPNLNVIRPADANEVREAWCAAVGRRDGPTALVFSRQNVPTFDRGFFAPAEGLHRGAYVLADMGDNSPEIILMASGSEVSLIVEAGVRLVMEGISLRLVSFPSWELFAGQEQEYRDAVLPPAVTARLAVEAGVSQGWERWVGESGKVISVESYGASAPYKIIFENFGFTVENVITQAKSQLTTRVSVL
jgi:transketolase